MISWNLNFVDKIPIYKQLVNHVQLAVLNGDLRPGEELPSQRQLASILNVSRASVVRAMAEMVDAGLIELSERSKAVVSDLSTRGVQWDVYFRRSGHRYCNIQRSSRIDGKEINLSRLSLSSDFRACEEDLPLLNRLKAEIGDFHELKRNYIQGIEPLQTALLSHLAKHGIACKKNELLLVASPVQAISFVAELLLAKGVQLYYQTPSDINYFGYLESYGAQLIGLPGDKEGVIVEKLMEEGNPQNDKILFLWSSCHPPTNVSLSRARRDRIVEVCRTHNIPIIDNCMLEPYNISQEGVHRIVSSDTLASTIQIGAFPRGMAPGTWLSWIVADPRIILRLEDIKEKRFRSLDVLSQLILYRILEDGSLDKYHRSVNQKLREDSSDYNALIEKYLGDIASWDSLSSGWCFWIKFNPLIDTTLLFEACRGITFNPGSFYEPSDTSHILLNPASLTIEQLEVGLKKLRKEIFYLFPKLKELGFKNDA